MKIVLLILCVAVTAFADTQCDNRNGQCQDDSQHCDGWYETGLCDGPASRKCCVPPGDDSSCENRGGKCQDDKLACNGRYESGLCSGPNDRRCCLPSGLCSACSLINMISRAEWGARSPNGRSFMNVPVQYTFIHHTVGNRCFTQSACSAECRSIQNWHMDGNGWSDIGYSFLVGEDGNAYEGRGWGVVGAHTSGYNSVSHAISYMGDFTNTLPDTKSLDIGQLIIDCGIDNGNIRSNYNLGGHRDVGATSCPGNTLYTEIQTWPNYGL
ncbi:peptidoglycan-recognition protein SC2-like [Glandiceps talaboti]